MVVWVVVVDLIFSSCNVSQTWIFGRDMQYQRKPVTLQPSPSLTLASSPPHHYRHHVWRCSGWIFWLKIISQDKRAWMLSSWYLQCDPGDEEITFLCVVENWVKMTILIVENGYRSFRMSCRMCLIVKLAPQNRWLWRNITGKKNVKMNLGKKGLLFLRGLPLGGGLTVTVHCNVVHFWQQLCDVMLCFRSSEPS